jgi:hypothetical protein
MGAVDYDHGGWFQPGKRPEVGLNEFEVYELLLPEEQFRYFQGSPFFRAVAHQTAEEIHADAPTIRLHAALVRPRSGKVGVSGRAGMRSELDDLFRVDCLGGRRTSSSTFA